MTHSYDFLQNHIRPTTKDDIPALLDIINAAYRNPAGWTTEAHLVEGARAVEKDLLELIVDRLPHTGVFLTYLNDNVPAGCINVEIKKNGKGYFGMFAVKQEIQGKGIGNTLMNASFDVMRNAGCSLCEITVLKDRQDIQAWYGRKGFIPTGQTMPFPKNAGRSKLKPGVDPLLIYMEKQL